MKKYVTILVALMVTMFGVNAFAFTPPPAPPNGGYVVDMAGKLSDSDIKKLNQKIDRISKATKNEFGILLLQDMGDDNIEDVANATYKAWGVGKRGLDNGCLIVVAIKERKSRIETGKGVEGEVPDLKAKDVLKANLNPHLKNGDFYGGFNDTLDALSGLMDSRQGQKADPPPVTQGGGGCSVSTGAGIGYVGLGLVLLVLALFVARARANSKRRAQELMDELERKMERDAMAKRIQKEKQVAADKERDRLASAKRERQDASKVVYPISAPMPVMAAIRPPAPVKAPKTVLPTSHYKPAPVAVVPAVVTAAVAAEVLAAATKASARREAEEQRSRQEAEERQARLRREAEANRRRQEEDDRRRRDEEDERRRRDSYSSSSSSSSWDIFGGSSGGGSDSGGGFGGGDSGGGGSSSDW